MRFAGQLVQLFVHGHHQRDRPAVGEFFAFADDIVLDLFHRLLVDKGLVQFVTVDDLGGVFVDLEDVAVFDQDDIVVRIIPDVILDKLLLPEQHAVFAVDRDDIPRPGSFDHYPDVFLRGVARNVYETAFFLDNVGTAFVKMPDEAADILFVARDDACRQHDGVALFDLDAFECRGRHIPQCGPHLALRTGDEITDLVIIERPRGAEVDHRAVRDL